MKHISTQDWEQCDSHIQKFADANFSNDCVGTDCNGNNSHQQGALNPPQIGEACLSKCFSLVIELVSSLFEISAEGLQGQTRGTAPICQARQICMYLLHTSLSIPYPEIGRLFSRDRTTISHACMIVEDLRDDDAIDKDLVRIESILEIVKALGRDESCLELGNTQ